MTVDTLIAMIEQYRGCGKIFVWNNELGEYLLITSVTFDEDLARVTIHGDLER